VYVSKERKVMKKGKSLVFSGASVLAVLVLLLFVTSKIIILGGFGRLETRLVRQDMNRVLDTLSNELANLERTLTDWSEWDDTCAFINGRDPNYLKSNVSVKTFSDLNLNFMIFINSSGRIIYSGMYVPDEEKLGTVPKAMLKHLSVSGPLLGFTGTQKGTTGLILLPEGPLMVASHAIVSTEGKGPRRGTVVFGRFLDSKETEKLSRITHISLKFPRIGDRRVPADIMDNLMSQIGADQVIVRADSEKSISGYGAFRDVYGRPIILAHISSPRTVYNSGKQTIIYFMAWITALAILAGAVILMLFNRLLKVERERQDKEASRRIEQEALKAQKLESLGVLAGGIAHDFNNLLTGIMGNISLAKMHVQKDNKASARLEEAERASERARDLTQQLLTFSKGGAPVKKTASIAQLVKDSASFATHGSNVRCEFSLPDALWPVSVDQGQISQVINNLIINADQAMPSGGKIRVAGKNVTIKPGDMFPLKEGNYVSISVIDQGVGIDEENLRKIFDPYFTTKEKGSGLGLATVYSILKNHGGYVDVASKTGEGTTFTVYLPASDSVPETESKSEGNGMPVPGKGRILIMDDEETIRDIAAEIVTHLGYDAVVCGDGAEAVELYGMARRSEQPFDTVIMDLTIPGGMGGREAMARLLEIDPQVKAIVSSGYSNDPILARYREYGFCGVMAKPYKVEDFTEILKSCVLERSCARA
jgi:signal transduction histidine kinase/ActR/RegA family two-component response regulator